MSTLRLSLHGDAEAVAQALAQVDTFSEAAGLDSSLRFRLQVCVAEAVNNIVEHGAGRIGLIGLVCRVGSQALTVRISDSAMPLQEIPGAEFPHGEAESGRGWPILHQWTDGLSYRTSAGLNHLYLTLRRDTV